MDTILRVTHTPANKMAQSTTQVDPYEAAMQAAGTWVLDVKHVVSNMKLYLKQNTEQRESQAEKPPRNIAAEFEFLYSLISPAFVRVRFEIVNVDGSEHKLLDYTPRTTKNENKNQLLEPNFDYLNDPNIIVKRVILSQNRNCANFKYPLTFQANGLVLCSNTWNVLSIPPHALNFRFNRKRVVETLDSYRIYAILDGTIVNLYYFESKWCFSSANGYQLNEYKWMGEKTYEEAFNEVTKLYPEFAYDKLNTSCTYSIGFRHNDFHPFVADGPKMWLVQCISVENTESGVAAVDITNNTDIGIPTQKPLEVESFKPFGQPNVDNKTTYENLLQINRNSTAMYLKCIITNSKKEPKRSNLLQIAQQIAASGDTSAIHYGYILRREPTEDDVFSNIIIESDLLRKIRQFMYNLPKGERMNELSARGVHIDNTTRQEYCIIRSYLDRNNRDLFMKLFPCFHSQFTKYDELIASIVNRIIQCYKNRRTKMKIQNTSGKRPNVSDNTVIIDRLAAPLMNHISSIEPQLTPHNPKTRDIIYDYVVRSEYVDLFFSVIQQQKAHVR